MKKIEIVYYLDRVITRTSCIDKSEFEENYKIESFYRPALKIQTDKINNLIVLDNYGKFKLMKNVYNSRILKMTEKEKSLLLTDNIHFKKLYNTISKLSETELDINL